MNEYKKLIKNDEWRWQNVPYCVAISGDGRHSAVYNRRYELIHEEASPALLAFVAGIDRYKKPGFNFSYPEQRPSWLEAGSEDDVLLCFTYNDGDTRNFKHLMSIPMV